MKAFEKWWEEQCKARIGNNNVMTISKLTWREALEEVQRQINEFNTNFVGDIENWIDEELEN